jgi:hypothetical protein
MGGDAQRREIDKKKKKRVVADGHFPGGVAKAKVSELLSSNRERQIDKSNSPC